jgi:hypothetical protein
LQLYQFKFNIQGINTLLLGYIDTLPVRQAGKALRKEKENVAKQIINALLCSL